MAFSGEFRCVLEERFRTTFPARWRDELKGAQADKQDEKLVLWLTKGPQGGLWGFTPRAWERFSGRIEAQLKGVNVLDPGASMLRHLFLAPAQEVAIDRHARMLVPDTLRSYAKLESEAVWVGAGGYVELYSRARWAQRETEIAEKLRSGELAFAAEKFNLTMD